MPSSCGETIEQSDHDATAPPGELPDLDNPADIHRQQKALQDQDGCHADHDCIADERDVADDAPTAVLAST